MRKIILLATVIASGAASAAHNPAHCRVGEVASLKGTVELVRHDQTVAPEVGAKICRGDLFRTKAGSVAELKLRDGTKLTVGKDSEMVIRDYRIFRKQPNIALFDLLKGAFRSVSGTITKRPHRFEVKTSVATIGVRGTDFWGGFGVTPDGALDVIMLEGHGVYVKNDKGQIELDKPGLGTTVAADGSLAEPKAWAAEKLNRAVATITPD
ncbi:MAG TPA: FecR family protein [Fluviicoccus sp.]|nr:FecR family protein [Fluviicoccus sp.]